MELPARYSLGRLLRGEFQELRTGLHGPGAPLGLRDRPGRFNLCLEFPQEISSDFTSLDGWAKQGRSQVSNGFTDISISFLAGPIRPLLEKLFEAGPRSGPEGLSEVEPY